MAIIDKYPGAQAVTLRFAGNCGNCLQPVCWNENDQLVHVGTLEMRCHIYATIANEENM